MTLGNKIKLFCSAAMLSSTAYVGASVVSVHATSDDNANQDHGAIIDAGPVKLYRVNSEPKSLLVTATGEVRSGAWANAVLTKVEYVVPPADGMWEFNWNIVDYGGVGTDDIVTVRDDFLWQDYPEDDVKGVRVCGTNSCTEARIGAIEIMPSEVELYTSGGSEVPFPRSGGN